ncbi:Proteophosphoglycan 5 [Rhodotorula toruloides]
MPLQPSSVLTLPVELLRRIVDMAVDDGRWEDLTTVESLMRVIDLYKRREYTEDEFFDTFSERTCSLFRRLEASGPHWSGALSDTQQTTYTNIYLRLPKVEDIAFCAVAEEAKKLVYPRLTHFFADAGLPRYAMTPNETDNPRSKIDYDGLALLDPIRVTSVVFGTIFNLSSLAAVRSPLRALTLDTEGCVSMCRTLVQLLAAYQDTIEYLKVSALLVTDPNCPRPSLPRLRHLVAKVPEPVGFASLFTSSPIEILDLAILSPYGPLGNSLADTVHQLRNTLEIIMVDAQLLGSPATDFGNLPELWKADGIGCIIPLKEDPFWMKEIRHFDEFQRAKKVGGIGIISDDMLHGGWELVREY